MAFIEINDISKTYTTDGRTVEALSHVSLGIEQGTFVVIIGGSGCGKSTLLNAIGGFDLPSSGTITIDGEAVRRPDVRRQMIFQNYGLFPWRTAAGNVAFALENNKAVSKEERLRRVDEALRTVGLEQMADAFPQSLSGGQRQRVAVARALAAEPEVVLMDEPFGALDAITKMHLQDEVRRICTDGKRTVLMVTHDIDEAVYLADRIIVMKPSPGRVYKDIKVKLGYPRNRASSAFLELRSRLLKHLGLAMNIEPDYVI